MVCDPCDISNLAKICCETCYLQYKWALLSGVSEAERIIVFWSDRVLERSPLWSHIVAFYSWCRRITIYSSVEENWKNCFKKQKIWKWEVCPEVRGSSGLCPQTGILGYTRKTLGSSMVNLRTYKKIMWPADKICDQTKTRETKVPKPSFIRAIPYEDSWAAAELRRCLHSIHLIHLV